MKSFDLTFNGAVLPERDPGQVKQDLARLFSIQDSTLIEEIFSGKTIVLRHNLDRKTAADYFRRISLRFVIRNDVQCQASLDTSDMSDGRDSNFSTRMCVA